MSGCGPCGSTVLAVRLVNLCFRTGFIVCRGGVEQRETIAAEEGAACRARCDNFFDERWFPERFANGISTTLEQLATSALRRRNHHDKPVVRDSEGIFILGAVHSWAEILRRRPLKILGSQRISRVLGRRGFAGFGDEHTTKPGGIGSRGRSQVMPGRREQKFAGRNAERGSTQRCAPDCADCHQSLHHSQTFPPQVENAQGVATSAHRGGVRVSVAISGQSFLSAKSLWEAASSPL